MKPKNTHFPELAPSELAVMKSLWKSGRSSVREVHEAISQRQGWAYSTTKTVMDRMVKKQFLRRDNFHGVFLYQPLLSKAQGLARLVRDFAERIVELDPAPVVALFSRSEALTEKEIEELSQLLADGEENP
ncbi:MAG: BlaI/MecI/CopY family transcriptional regulator [Deltaproteobacteria bacterium]|nr:BlaI/MecI/CopY family transcriptional regulator [Deltaproteobacteria bacterium]